MGTYQPEDDGYEVASVDRGAVDIFVIIAECVSARHCVATETQLELLCMYICPSHIGMLCTHAHNPMSFTRCEAFFALCTPSLIMLPYLLLCVCG